MEEKAMQQNSPVHDMPQDSEALQSLYQEYLGPIYRYVYGKVGNREEAEDLTSQVFIKVVSGLDFTRNPQSTRSWLFQVVRTTIADYWRAYYRTATSSLEALVESGWEGPTGREFEDDARLFESSCALDSVQCILKTLPERDREVLTCRFLLGLSIQETALQMNLTEGNIKTLQFRALKRAADLTDLTCVMN
jgi:RNA polymerase sigma-70 factor (ECF subfamily)